MLKYLYILSFFTFFGLSAQEEVVQSVYFETDKFQVDTKQAKEIVAFIQRKSKCNSQRSYVS